MIKIYLIALLFGLGLFANETTETPFSLHIKMIFLDENIEKLSSVRIDEEWEEPKIGRLKVEGRQRRRAESNLPSLSLKAFNGHDFEVDIVTKEFADKLFDKLKRIKQIDFDAKVQGCYGRAHQMSKALTRAKINNGKVFVLGDLRLDYVNDKGNPTFVEWNGHVAPFLIVHIDGENIPYVFDPSIFDEPVTVHDWVKVQTKKYEKIEMIAEKTEVYFSEKFNYNWTDRAENYQDFTNSDQKFASE